MQGMIYIDENKWAPHKAGNDYSEVELLNTPIYHKLIDEYGISDEYALQLSRQCIDQMYTTLQTRPKKVRPKAKPCGRCAGNDLRDVMQAGRKRDLLPAIVPQKMRKPWWKRLFFWT